MALTIDVVLQKKPRFGKKPWKEVACRVNASIQTEPSVEAMQDRFGTIVGGHEAADGSDLGWEFVQPDPTDEGMSVMTSVTIRRG